jgi:hypothetical protein
MVLTAQQVGVIDAISRPGRRAAKARPRKYCAVMEHVHLDDTGV